MLIIPYQQATIQRDKSHWKICEACTEAKNAHPSANSTKLQSCRTGAREATSHEIEGAPTAGPLS